MTKKQRLVVILLAAGDLVVLSLLCGVIVFSLLGQPGTRQAALPTPTPTGIPTPTPIPTWTPTPTLAPYTPPVLPTPTLVPLTAEEATALAQVEREVATLRGLSPLRSVPRWKITRSQLRHRFADMFVSGDWEEEARSLALVLSAFDFIPPDTDLTHLWKDVFSEQIVGFYVAETEEIYVVSSADATDALERLVFAHEFGHALQDQHFDLEALGLRVTSESEYNADQIQAIRSLVEGDAVLIQEQYVERYFTEADALEVLLNLMFGSASTGSDSTPRVINETFQFPYTDGRDFVNTLYKRGGWQAVNDAYAAPPVSTEQILHPERYLAGEQPVLVSLAPLTATLGSGWRLIYDDSVGEFFLSLYLENQLDPEEVTTAVDGWGGDRCTVYHNDAAGETVLFLRVVWDAPAEAEEFLDAYVSYADGRFGHPADQIGGGLACWQSRDALCVAWEGDSVTIALGPNRAVVDSVLAAGLSE
jgi:hypothetical protein